MSTLPLIVCLDSATLPQAQPQIGVAHRWQAYDLTQPDEVVSRLHGATVAITNKVALNHEQLEQLPDLKLIAVAATGYNIIDVGACRDLGITVCNVPAYSTDGVAEHTLMLMLALRHRLHEAEAASQIWAHSPIFCVFPSPILELKGATLSLIGGGSIGNRVAELAQAFGMNILRAERRQATSIRPGYVPFEQALAQADILSIHCPLNAETRGIIGAAEITQMKPSALIINTARGGLVDEAALVQALENGSIGGAAVDVLAQEPPAADNPLLKPHPRLIVTPHVAWASEPSLQRMAMILQQNIEGFLSGNHQNRVTG